MPAHESPYDRYVRLAELSAHWPARSDASASCPAVVGAQALELLRLLTTDVLLDNRPEARQHERCRRVVELAERAVLLLEESAPDGVGSAGPSPVAPPVPPVLPDGVGAWSGPLVQRLQDVATRGVAVCGDGTTAEQARAVRLTRPARWHGPEDALFRTTHQIIECWLRLLLHHADLAHDAATGRDWSTAAHQVELACRWFDLVTSTTALLELLVLADFHLLRVRLRDGTAADSRAAREALRQPGRLCRLLEADLSSRGLSVMQVLDRPRDHLAHHAYVSAVGLLGSRCQAFLQQHYVLAVATLGATTRGTRGGPAQDLASHAMHTPLPHLDEAKHHLSWVNGLRYSAVSGDLTALDERAAGIERRLPERRRGCSALAAAEVVGHYFEAIRDRDGDGWVSLFRDDGMLLDAEGARPYLGPRELRVFIEGTFQAFRQIAPTFAVEAFHDGVADVGWHMAALSSLGSQVRFGGRARFSLDAEEHLQLVSYDWSAFDVAKAVWPAGSAAWEVASPSPLADDRPAAPSRR